MTVAKIGYFTVAKTTLSRVTHPTLKTYGYYFIQFVSGFNVFTFEMIATAGGRAGTSLTWCRVFTAYETGLPLRGFSGVSVH